VNGPVELHTPPGELEARSHAAIASTPVSRKERALRLAALGPYPTPLARIPRVDETECVGCNLCALVCPVDECITMVRVDAGVPSETWDERTRGAACVIDPNQG
jgi:dihydropyrimidine dehydrogenase (NAD+) subunit PreA